MMDKDESPAKCSNPIDVTVLADYWLALLKGSDEEALEGHLLECDKCGDRLREVIALAEGVRELARSGSLRMVVSDVFLKSAADDGLRIRQYAPISRGSVECTVTAEDDILIGRLAANLSDVRRIDLCVCNDAGIEQGRLRDIPFQPGASSVIWQESMTFAKAAPTHRLIYRLVSVDETGSDHPLGEYTFNHTRSLPGPGEWLQPRHDGDRQ
jgi:hypothetical protein